MRRLPKFVRIVGQKVLIEKVPGLTHNVADEDRDHDHEQQAAAAYGVFDPLYPTIYLESGMGFERAKNTLVHECLHAIINIANIGSCESEEELVRALTPPLFAFIRENRGAIAFLQES